MRKDRSAFNFGMNWAKYSKNSLNNQKFTAALNSLDQLIGKERIIGARFLDVGCGSGIFAISASKLGAKEVIGIDKSDVSIKTSLKNVARFLPKNRIILRTKSIFDEDIAKLGKFDVVYSWGVLHHTGNMWKAIDISSKLVEAEGLFVISIYNKHWSSPIWKRIKYFFNISPLLVQKLMISFFYAIIYFVKFLITKKNPLSTMRRGMTFYYNLIDWIGGYPYEYALKDEIIHFIENNGFKLIKFINSPVPTGCNEFVFRKVSRDT